MKLTRGQFVFQTFKKLPASTHGAGGEGRHEAGRRESLGKHWAGRREAEERQKRGMARKDFSLN